MYCTPAKMPSERAEGTLKREAVKREVKGSAWGVYTHAHFRSSDTARPGTRSSSAPAQPTRCDRAASPCRCSAMQALLLEDLWQSQRGRLARHGRGRLPRHI